MSSPIRHFSSKKSLSSYNIFPKVTIPFTGTPFLEFFYDKVIMGMRDLIKYNPGFTVSDVQLLKVGRHFRVDKDSKLIVGRNHQENQKLLKLAHRGDLCFSPADLPGPVGIGTGFFSNGHIEMASSIIARYSDGQGCQHLKISYKRIPSEKGEHITVFPAQESQLQNLRI